MIHGTLRQAARAMGATALHGSGRFQGVATDSRQATPGCLFVPLAGEHGDGHDYIRQAIERGAAASLWQVGRPNPPQGLPLLWVDDCLAALQRLSAAWRRELPCTVVGITGSNGKTSTKDILAGMLSAVGKTQKTQGNYNNHIGVPLTLLSLDEDTRYAVVEMGMSAPGEIDQLAGWVRPDIGVITSIGEAHLDKLGSLEAIADAKWEMVRHIAPGGTLILPGDCELLRGRPIPNPLMVKTFGEEAGNSLYLKAVRATDEGVWVTASHPACPELHIPMLGRHQALNTLAAILAARSAGLDFADIARGVALIQPTDGRNQLLRLGEITVLDDTYTSNPRSVAAALDTLYLMPGGRKIFVMGDMVGLGADSEALHRRVGMLLDARRLDALFAIGPDTRYTVDVAQSTFGARARHFDREEDLMQALLDYAHEPCTILLKASREMRFETLVGEPQGRCLKARG